MVTIIYIITVEFVCCILSSICDAGHDNQEVIQIAEVLTEISEYICPVIRLFGMHMDAQ